MNPCRILAALVLALLTSATAHAAGPLLLNDKPGNPQPLRWNTSTPIPVYTDLGVFSYDFDRVTPFITNARANEMVKFAIAQWSKVPTSTLRAYWAGDFTQVPTIGVDVTVDNARQVYAQENGRGLHVVYDTTGEILADFFGVSPDSVLGIAFPKIAIDSDGDGHEDTIVEAMALMNGYAVQANDRDGKFFNGIMTHEFGHAFNLSHSQVNGQMAYFSMPGWFDLYPGVPGCVAPRHIEGWGGNDMPARYVETMFPYINNAAQIGAEMATVDMPDDIAAISNLYPTAAYRSNTGSIGGVLRLKDGRTPYSGVNIIARNVNDPLGDAVSAMTGDQTQGKIGPDGRFTIANLKPGQSYVLYMEEIVAGGYPTMPRPLVSEAEYWNTAESASPATDKPCDATAITAVPGTTQTANLVFNGYDQGVQFFPVVDAFLVDLSKNGGRASGIFYATQFTWDINKGIEVMPPNVLASTGSMTRDGQKILVNADLDGNGINSAALWSSTGKLTNLGSLNGDTCGGQGFIGFSSSYGIALDDDAHTAVGLAYLDVHHDGNCMDSFGGAVVPFIWTERGGMRKLDDAGFDYSTEGWLRAQAVSGDGSVVLGETNYSKAMAWINQGKRIDLFKLHGAVNAYAVNRDGTRVMLDTVKSVIRSYDGWSYEDFISNGPLLWNPKQGPNAVTRVAGLRWCVDVALLPYYDWITGQYVDRCASESPSSIQADIGMVPLQINDMSDDGKVIIGRAGSFFYGSFEGVMWEEGVGWIKLSDFFRKQGVAEAYRYGMQNPGSINGAGNEMVGGLLGVMSTWYVDMKQVFVCQNGSSVQVGFPNGFVAKIQSGAKMGRCEHQG
jgi:hypothetical protein